MKKGRFLNDFEEPPRLLGIIRRYRKYPSVRRHFVIYLAIVVAVALVFFVWFAFRQRSKPVPVGAGPGPHLVGFDLTKDTNSVFTGYVTNTGAVPIQINACSWEYEDQHGQVKNAPRGWYGEHMWKGVTNFVPVPSFGGPEEVARLKLLAVTDTLLPNGVAKISFDDIPAEAKRVRLIFQYAYDAGALRKEVSKGLNKLPLGSTSAQQKYWLNEHGLLYGKYSRTYEGNWVSY